MIPLKEIGECLITVGENEYFFRPSFANMTRIGEPQEVVQAFYDVHNDNATPLFKRAMEAYGRIPDWLVSHVSRPVFSKPTLMAAMAILQACCDQDLNRLTGEIVPGRSGKWAFVYRKGVMPEAEMVLLAQSLITHGIIGKAKVRQLQRHESSQGATEFNAFEYISAARNHLGMSRAEAEQLTMTEFALMLAQKFPDQKGFTREEYDQVADNYLARKARRLKKV
ncbi:DUF6246 family protein [Pantoea sp. A4]|uniref:DUF6246 family protein n=1 Tax=Pantoea sp. A4 TaxID=1225184 RepID=UPI0004750399|nr:DUF6246 family protein [Pantoea sp. A4]